MTNTNVDRKGTGNPNAKRSDSDIRMMREYRAGGWSHKELALLFDMSLGRVSEICRGLAYPDSGGPIDGFRTGKLGRPPKIKL